MVRQLPPWFENVGKRVVRSPKVYIRDSGLLHALLGLKNQRELESHPKVGASWEGFALEQVIKFVPGDHYFWSTHGGGEVDLVVMRHAKKWGFEFKRSDAPRLSASMKQSCDDLRLDHLWVVYPGSKAYALSPHVTVIPLKDVSSLQASTMIE